VNQPALPATLRPLDRASRADHCYLQPLDCCYFLGEYRPGSYAGDRLRQLIANFKCRPATAQRNPMCLRHKRRAVAAVAAALRAALARSAVEAATWVPVPPSAAAGQPDYDDRLQQALRAAFGDYDLDLRLLLLHTGSMAPDHAAAVRIDQHSLYRRLRVDVALLQAWPLRTRIVVFDDLLVTGKHFKCCEQRLREQLPQIPICGCFLARRVLSPHRRGVPGRQCADYEK
jgi:hypothetical protein